MAKQPYHTHRVYSFSNFSYLGAKIQDQLTASQLFYLPTLAACVPNDTLNLSEEESRHCVKVMRMSKGDAIFFTDGRGRMAEALIQQADFRRCTVQIKALSQQARPRPYHFHLGIAPTKNAERMEWLVEKCVEIGLDALTFLQTENTERDYFNLGRMEKKAVAALKQSLQAWLPTLNGPVELSHFLASLPDLAQIPNAQRFIAYVDLDNPQTLFGSLAAGSEVCVLVGPEGDFSPQELNLALAAGFQKISLGPTRLRTETAGLVSCHTVALRNQMG